MTAYPTAAPGISPIEHPGEQHRRLLDPKLKTAYLLGICHQLKQREQRNQEEIASQCLYKDNSVISPGTWTHVRKERCDMTLTQSYLK